MEFVEGYVHRGWVNCVKDGEEYDKPWKWLKTDIGMIYGLLFWEVKRFFTVKVLITAPKI